MIDKDIIFEGKGVVQVRRNLDILRASREENISHVDRFTELTIKCKICGKIEKITVGRIASSINENNTYEPICKSCKMSLGKYKDNYELSLSFVKSKPEIFKRISWEDPQAPNIKTSFARVVCSKCNKIEYISARDFLKNKFYENLYVCEDCLNGLTPKEDNFGKQDSYYQISEDLKEFLILTRVRQNNKFITKWLNRNPSLIEEINSLIKEDSISLFKKILLIRNDVKVEYCPICGEVCKFESSGSSFIKTCGKKECIEAQTKATCLEIYGSEAPYQNEAVKEKGKQTTLERYGVENIFQDTEYIKKRTKEKYGVENIFEDKEYISEK